MQKQDPKISIVIPCYEMHGYGAQFLVDCLDSIKIQSFKDIEIVIPDNSDNEDIFGVYTSFVFKEDIPVTYFKNHKKGISANTNAGMKRSKGEIIKILNQDDYFFHERALEEIARAFDEKTVWLATGCVHTLDGNETFAPHYAKYSEDLFLGNNTIGGPSVISLRNRDLLFFDEKLTWLLDVDLYTRYHDTYGKPKILNSLNIVSRQHPKQVTNVLSNSIKSWEHDYLNKKFL